jgi:hypothetical protein
MTDWRSRYSFTMGLYVPWVRWFWLGGTCMCVCDVCIGTIWRVPENELKFIGLSESVLLFRVGRLLYVCMHLWMYIWMYWNDMATSRKGTQIMKLNESVLLFHVGRLLYVCMHVCMYWNHSNIKQETHKVSSLTYVTKFPMQQSVFQNVLMNKVNVSVSLWACVWVWVSITVLYLRVKLCGMMYTCVSFRVCKCAYMLHSCMGCNGM